MAESEMPKVRKGEIQWHWVLWTIHLYILGGYGLCTAASTVMWPTVFFGLFIIGIGTLGLTMGAHRLWAHQSFEARWYIKLFLILAHTLAGVGPIYDWVLDHRVHHKYFGTDKDPFDHNQGFLYSHIIANVKSKPADYEKITKSIDMRDIETDGWVTFQRTFYWPLLIIFGLLLPLNAPLEYWGDSLINAVLILGFVRLAVLQNICWLIQSGIHIWALKPHEKYPPDDNLVFIISKSYWPHYHYLLPIDWKCGEFGSYDKGFTTTVIKIFNIFDLIYGLKTVSSDNVRQGLYGVSQKKPLTDVLDEIKEAAKLETTHEKLYFKHH